MVCLDCIRDLHFIITIYNLLPFFTHSLCRQPGASLIIIKGHRHLHECAYIGDDSSEEEDELREIAEEKAQREVSSFFFVGFANNNNLQINSL